MTMITNPQNKQTDKNFVLTTLEVNMCHLKIQHKYALKTNRFYVTTVEKWTHSRSELLE